MTVRFSSLHVIEHLGLGTYGDPIDYLADLFTTLSYLQSFHTFLSELLYPYSFVHAFLKFININMIVSITRRSRAVNSVYKGLQTD